MSLLHKTCPHCKRSETHRLMHDRGDAFAWCSHCARVHRLNELERKRALASDLGRFLATAQRVASL